MDEVDKLTAEQREAVVAAKPLRTAPAPRTTVGRRIRDTLRDHVIGTRTWAQIRSEYRVLFRETVATQTVGSDLVGQAVDAIIDQLPMPETSVGRDLGRVLKKVGSDAVKRYYEAKSAQFERDLRASTLLDAVRKVETQAGSPVFLTANAAAAFRRTAPQVLSTQPLHEAPPRLKHVQPKAPAPATPPDRDSEVFRWADAYASYEDFFTGRAGTVDSTSRTAFLKDLSRAPGVSESTALSIRTSLQQMRDLEQQAVKMATTPSALDGNPQVGGVIIGETGRNVGNHITDISWRVADNRVRLSFVANGRDFALGEFDGELTRAALAYAADDRRLAVTVIRAKNEREPAKTGRVLLHPSLLDTNIGRDVLEADGFVFDATQRSIDRDRQMADLEILHVLYETALLARLVGPAPTADAKQLLAKQLSGITERGRRHAAKILSDVPMWKEESRCLLLARPEYYDRETTQAIRTAVAEGIRSLESLASRMQSLPIPPKRADRPALIERLSAVPRLEFRSGVRERAYDIDDEAAFLKGSDAL